MEGDSGDGAVEANVDVILGTAGWIDSVTEDLNNDVQTLMRQFRRLLDRWSGSAADTHSHAWTEWFNDANSLVGALEDDAAALCDSAARYLGIDDHTADNVHRAGSNLELNL